MSEEYYCLTCGVFHPHSVMTDEWICPNCHNRLKIKIEVNGYNYECERIPPEELRINDQVIRQFGDIYSIKAINRQGSTYLIAYEGYKTIQYSENDRIALINGRWVFG